MLCHSDCAGSLLLFDPSANITGISAVTLNRTAVHVSWMPLSLPSDGTLVGYTVYIQQDGLKSQHMPGGATQVDIVNLNLNVFYEVTIVAEISILGQSQNVNSSHVVYITPSHPTGTCMQPLYYCVQSICMARKIISSI